MNSRYQIRVNGVLDRRWIAWFGDLHVSSDGEETVISGPVADQAARHWLLAKVRDLGPLLISVRHLDPGRPSRVAFRAGHQEELMHPVIMRQHAAARPAATPIENADQVRKESEK